MAVPTTDRAGDVYDAAPDFVYAVSLLAALEDATGQEEHAIVLPFLGMARAELTEFGQRRPSHYVPVEVGDLRSGLADLEQRLTALLADSQVLQHSLRLDSARRLLRRGATLHRRGALASTKEPRSLTATPERRPGRTRSVSDGLGRVDP